jgi:hypothetical protein
MQNQNNPSEHQSENESKAYNLMDGATGEGLKVIRELEEQRKISADSEMPLDERLEAYEDIFDSEVGDTSLVREFSSNSKVAIQPARKRIELLSPRPWMLYEGALIPSRWLHVEITASPWRWLPHSPGCNAKFVFLITIIPIG